MSQQYKPVLLITGATGYVAHHILELIDTIYPSYTIYATYNTKNPILNSNNEFKSMHHIKLDLSDDKSITSAVDSMFKNNIIPEIIIHCAAITSPRICEENKDETIKINCPMLFIDTLLLYYNKLQQFDKNPLFIFFSTDHVYDGKLSHINTIHHPSMYDNEEESKTENKIDVIYTEESACHPINSYGRGKLMMEKYLLMKWKNLVILRCSVIYGPENKLKKTILQFIVHKLKRNTNEKVVLFKNEKRCFICIDSIVKTIEYFIKQYYETNKEYHDVYNCGGINALTRVEFGEICANIYELDAKKIFPVNRYDVKEAWAHAVPNPQDLTKSSNKLFMELKRFYVFPSFINNIKHIVELNEPPEFSVRSISYNNF
eukprot:206028_1